MNHEHEAAEAALPLSRRRFLAQSTLIAAAVPFSPGTHEISATLAPPQPAPPPPVTRVLSEWVVGCRKSDVPVAVRHEALRSIVNWVGVAIGGSQQDAVSIVLAALAPLSCDTSASLFGRTEKLDLLRASLVTGISSHVLDFDDTDLATIIHPAGPVASALFALCQSHPMSGADLLHAFILGVEVECRLGRAIYPSHYDMGWHITGTCGAFGAAAACAKALHFDTLRMQMAIGIAATEAAGLKIMFGSMCKSLNMGRAAENGLLAALLAAKGFTSSEQSLEGKDGYIDATSTHHDYSVLTQDLGKHFEISRDTYKPFACGIVIHPAIDAALQLRSEYRLQPSEVRSIQVRANPLVLQLTGKQDPKDGLEGKFSIYHSVAVAIVRGYAGPEEYTDAAVNDPTVIALRRRVTVQPDPSVRTDEAFMSIMPNTGRELEKHVEHAVGSIDHPLSDAELNTKFRQLTKNILPKTQSEKLLSAVWNLESATNAAEIPRLGARQRGEERS